MQGRSTPPMIKEKALALYATTRSYQEVGEQLKLNRSTIHGLVANAVDFEQFRTETGQAYIIRAWQKIEKLQEKLNQKIDESNLDDVSIDSLVNAITRLHQTVTNATSYIVNVNQQVNAIVDNSDDIEKEAYSYIGQQYGLTVEQVKEKLAKV